MSKKLQEWDTLIKQRKLSIQQGDSMKFEGKIELPLEDGKGFKTLVEVKKQLLLKAANGTEFKENRAAARRRSLERLQAYGRMRAEH